MKKKASEIDDLIQDQAFIEWIRSGSSPNAPFYLDWISNHPNQHELLNKAQKLVRSLQFEQDSLSESESAALWNRISPSNKAPVKIVSHTSRRRWLYAAAAISATLLVAWAAFNGWSNPHKTEYHTAYGEKKEITLPDGSLVTLNANSSLHFQQNDPRKIWLSGEAFFEVEKKPATNAKFLVLTEDLTVQVLGTSFNVNSRNEETKVFLEEGKVTLQLETATDNKVEMIPGELARYSKKKKKALVKNKVDALENISWKDGTLLFKNAALSEVMKRLSEIYGITFLLKNDSLSQQTITGGVPIKNLEIALETLQTVYEIKIEQRADQYLIGQ